MLCLFTSQRQEPMQRQRLLFNSNIILSLTCLHEKKKRRLMEANKDQF